MIGVAAGTTPLKVERKVMEKYRRIKIKNQYSRLSELITTETSKPKLPLPAFLEEATAYIKTLERKVKELRSKKKQLSIVPELTVKEVGGETLVVNLITGLGRKFILCEILSVLHELGVNVVSAHTSTASDKIFYTVYSQAYSPRIGIIETSIIEARLKQLISDI